MGKDTYIPGFYSNSTIREIIKPNIKNNNLNFCANYWITDKGDTYGCAHNYVVFYEKYFRKFLNKNINLLEIGIAAGSSLKMWNSWFDRATIYAIDNNINCSKVCNDYKNIHLIIQDIKTYNTNIKFDIIIDDGCHLASFIISAFNTLWSNIKKGGFYVIEDIQACKSDNYIKTNLKAMNIPINFDNIKNNSREILDDFLKNISNFKDTNVTIHNKIVFIQKI